MSRTLTSRSNNEKAKQTDETTITSEMGEVGESSTEISSDSTLAGLIDSNKRFWWTIAGFSGSLAVGLGAFGAHGLKARVTDTYYLDVWQTAYQYHMAHTLAIAIAPVAVGLAQQYRMKHGMSVMQALRHNLFGTKFSSQQLSKSSSRATPRSLGVWSARAFTFGIVFFSGSLYALTLSENKKWGAVAPIGGFGLIAGWLFLAIGI